MADNPRQVLASVAADETEPFDYTGPAAVFIRDDLEGGRAVIEYVVSTPDGATVRAYGEGPGIVPGPCGSTLRLTGRRLGDRAALSSAIVVGQAAGDTCGSAGEQRMAILMLYRAGVDPPKVTPEQVEDRAFGEKAASSTRNQILSYSYSNTALSGRAFGWYALPRAYTCDESTEMRAAALAVAGKDVDLTQFPRIAVLLHQSLRSGTCGWGGLGQVGCATADTVTSTKGQSTLWMWTNDGLPSAQTLTHEFGHNLGLAHAHSIAFPGDSIEVTDARATRVEYGDPFSVMGGGSGPFGASHKLLLGWIPTSDVARVEKSGDYVLKPLQSLSGTRALKIRRRPDSDDWLWLDYYTAGNSPAPGPGGRLVLRYESPSTGAASDVLWADFENRVRELTPGGIWRDNHSLLAIETGYPTAEGVPVSVRYETPCAKPSTNAVSLGPDGRTVPLEVSAAAGCAWWAGANASWLDAGGGELQTGAATLLVSALANPSLTRSAFLTVARQPVSVRQIGVVPAPAVVSVGPQDGVALNTRNQFTSELGIRDGAGADAVAEVHFLYNTTPIESGGCSFRLTLAGLQYRLLDASGMWSEPTDRQTAREVPACRVLNFYGGRYAIGPLRVGFSITLRVEAPTLYVRFVTAGGQTTEWQTAARYELTTGCYVGLIQSVLEVGAAGGTLYFGVAGGANCYWNLSFDETWIHLSGASGVATSYPSLSVEANPGNDDRQAKIRLGEQTLTILQRGKLSVQRATFNPSDLDLAAGATAASVIVTINPASATPKPDLVSDVPWLRVTDASYDSLFRQWVVTLGLDANTGERGRLGYLAVGGYYAVVRQGGTGLALSPLTDLVPAGGGSGLLSVTPDSPQASWKARSTVDWITLPDGAFGTGPGSVRYTVLRNPSTASRRGEVAVGTAKLRITQSGTGGVVGGSYTVKPFAGALPDGSGGPAGRMLFQRPTGLAVDSKGNLYVGDRLRQAIYRVGTDGVVHKVASGFTPDGIAIDRTDRVYVADVSRRRVSRIDETGLTRIAGNGLGGTTGEGGQATSAAVTPAGIAFDAGGNLLIADATYHVIRKVDSRGVITTIAGNGRAGSTGDGGPASQASVQGPEGIAVDAAGNIYFTERMASRVRRISPDGLIGSFAGTGTAGSSGDGGPAAKATLNRPCDVKVDAAGNVAIVENQGFRVRLVRPNGTIDLFAGSGAYGRKGDDGPAVKAELNFPHRAAFDLAGALYLAEYTSSGIRKIGPDGVIRHFAGLPDDDWSGTAPVSRLMDPTAVATDASGGVYIAEGEGRHLLRVAPDGTQAALAGDGLCCNTPAPGDALTARFNEIRDILPRSDGSVLLADHVGQYIYLVQDGRIRPFAGTGTAGNTGDGGPAIAARVNGPLSMAADAAGNVLFVDSGNGALRRIDTEGKITTVAKGIVPGATVLVAPDGSVLVGENTGPRRIRKVLADGTLEVVVPDCGSGFALEGTAGYLCLASGVSRYSPQAGLVRLTNATAGLTDGEVNISQARVQSLTRIRTDGKGNFYLVDRLAGRVYVMVPRF
jgi:sugar lactone lactonase YvrE